MKKVLLLLVFLLICLNVFSLTEKICIYPYNQEIDNYLKQYYSIDCKKASVNFLPESVLSGNQRVLEYICKNSDSELLIIPDISDLSGFNYYRVWVYDLKENSFELVYECITQKKAISKDVLTAIEPYITDKPVDYEEHEEVKEEKKEKGYNLKITSNVPAEVFFEGKSFGQTPVTIEEYTFPSVIRLKSEGYSDCYYMVDKKTGEINITLEGSELSTKENYKTARKNFYGSFGTMLLSFGLKAALPVFLETDTKAYKIADYISDGVIGVFGVNSVIALIQYYKNAKQVSP